MNQNMTDKKKDRPFVFVRCLTYNHEKYIEDALKGFVMQKTDFPFLAVVIDDCSTDGTADIVRRYEAQYPNIIKGIYLPYNFRSRGADKRPYYQQYIDKATYWAECEGDDYWTDPYKLQKQVDFMETHPECSVTFHRCKHYNIKTGETKDDDCASLFTDGKEIIKVDLDLYFSHWYTQPLTMVFRVDMYDLNVRKRYKYFRDTQQIYYLLKAGEGYILNFIGGVYVKHKGGISSLVNGVNYCDVSLPIDREFYWKTLDKGPKKNYIDTLDRCVLMYRDINKWESIRCALVRFIISGKPRSLIRNMKVIFGEK